MRKIEITKKFKKDYKRIGAGPHGAVINVLLQSVVSQLAADESLPRHYIDHDLTGDWKDHRECHLKPDLLLIYRKPDPDTLQLVRLGSHSELGL